VNNQTNKILLVDDEPGIRESVKAYLEFDNEFQVKVASNVNEALEILQRETPNLFISDIMMPQIDGYEFLKKIREDIKFKTIPFIFLTARGMTSDRIQGYQAHCDAYLSKPFEPEELRVIITNLLERRQETSHGENESGKLEEIYQEIRELKEQLGHPGSSYMVTNSPAHKIDLTPREQSILELVAQGLMNKEIAVQLNTSVRNVEKYVSRLFSKTDTNSRTELVRFALKNGLTQ
jgi:DNA-binding NarL/FixJ family response regulator